MPLLLVAMSLLLVVVPGATSSFWFLVEMHLVTTTYLQICLPEARLPDLRVEKTHRQIRRWPRPRAWRSAPVPLLARWAWMCTSALALLLGTKGIAALLGARTLLVAGTTTRNKGHRCAIRSKDATSSWHYY